MTLINVYMKDSEKKKMQEFIEKIEGKSVSDYVRNLINEEIKIDDLSTKMDPEEIIIPDYIPENKYIVFVNNAIVAVEDTPSQATLAAVDKGYDPPYIIKYKGTNTESAQHHAQEYFFMSLSEGWVLPYTPIENGTQLLLRVDFQAGKFSKKLVALIDTGASFV